jgi:oxygen-independent coproporphyrinogen-3 oxidase
MNEIRALDPSLLRRHSRGHLRQDAYPPPSAFRSGFSEAELRGAARESNEDPIPRALSLSVRLPSTEHATPGLAAFDSAQMPAYLSRLAREVGLIAPLFDRDRDVVQLHFGVACPGGLGMEQVGEIMYTLSRQFFFSRSRDRDFTIGLDPHRIDTDGLARLADLGFNRVRMSLSASDLEPATGVTPAPGARNVEALFAACRRLGFRSLHIDLRCGSSAQDAAVFNRALHRLLPLQPERIALVDAGWAGDEAADRPGLDPQDPAHMGQLLHTLEDLATAGYEPIGLDLFTLASDDLARARRCGSLRHNRLGFSALADTDEVGLGVGAISRIGESCSQNQRRLADWDAALERGILPVERGLVLSAEQRLRAEIQQSLLCDGRLEIDVLEQRHSIHFAEQFEGALQALQPMREDGLVEQASQRIRITRRGRPFVAAACAAFEREPALAPVAPS